MNNIRSLHWYSVLGLVIIGVDRLTKWYALTNCFSAAWTITPFFSCDVTLNRGISWGLFFTHNDLIFGLISWIIVVVTLGITVWSTWHYTKGYSIVGEVCVVSGSLANIADRFMYHGVIDFMVVHYKEWAWPAFNIADISIVTGIFLIFLAQLKS